MWHQTFYKNKKVKSVRDCRQFTVAPSMEKNTMPVMHVFDTNCVYTSAHASSDLFKNPKVGINL